MGKSFCVFGLSNKGFIPLLGGLMVCHSGFHLVLGVYWGLFLRETGGREESGKGICAQKERGGETERGQLFISRCLDILTAAVNGQGLGFKIFTDCFFIPSMINQKSVSRYFSLNAWKAQPERWEL